MTSLPTGDGALEGRLLRFVILIIGVAQGELAQGGRVALDAVEPRCPGGRSVEPNVVRVGVGQDRSLAVVAQVVQYDVQRARLGVAPPDPLQEGQKPPEEPGIPHDGVDPAVVERVNDLSRPGGGAAYPPRTI